MEYQVEDTSEEEAERKSSSDHLLLSRPWVFQLRETISQSCPTWPAILCGPVKVSYHAFLSLSIRIRDELIKSPVRIKRHAKVLLYHTDTVLSRIKYVCTTTALAMIGANFTLLEEKMPLRARIHVVEVYGPDIILDVSSTGSDSLLDLIPEEELSRLKHKRGCDFDTLSIIRLNMDEECIDKSYSRIVASPSNISYYSNVVKSNDSRAHQGSAVEQLQYDLFDNTNWANVTTNIFISVDTRKFPLFKKNDQACSSEYDAACEFPLGHFWCRSSYDDIAFVDWTSGSTGGLPKGCACKHSTLSNMFHAKYFSTNKLFQIGEREVVGVNLFNLWYWWQPITSGHTLAFLLTSEIKDIKLLFEGLRQMQVTAMDCITPSLLQTMLYCQKSSFDFDIPKTIIVGGEMLTLACATEFYNSFDMKRQGSGIDSGTGYRQPRLINLFSTTETGDCSYFHVSTEIIKELLNSNHKHCPIGLPIHGISMSIDVVEDKGLIVSGVDCDHYLCDPITTSKYFDSRGWLSYDRAEYIFVNDNKSIMLMGRSDDCVKVRGYKVDLNAVEEVILMSEAVVMVSVQHLASADSLIAFIVLKSEHMSASTVEPSKHPCFRFLDRLPKSHCPQIVEFLSEMPIGRTGKIDRREIMERYLAKAAASNFQSRQQGFDATDSSKYCPFTEEVFAAWRLLLPEWTETGGIDKSFWECGGHSLLAMQMCAKLRIPSSLLFGGDITTARHMIMHLAEQSSMKASEISTFTSLSPIFPTLEKVPNEAIAVIGMSGRWPGIGQTSCDDIFHALASEIDFEPLSPPPSTSGRGNVTQGFYLDEALLRGFDYRFWNMTKEDATCCDPQLRCFLEMSYEALCDGGIIVEPKSSEPLNCGVFACSGSLPHYLELLLDGQRLSDMRVSDPAKYFNLELGNDKDYLASRLAFLFNLVGPAECIQTACSSGLAAITHAVEAIRNGQCEIAIAGGISIFSPQQDHAHVPDMIWSVDGRCKPFDANATGTANCNGGQVFVLKRLSTAVKNKDPIYGCIKGCAIRNDGRLGKRNFNAPSSVGYVRTVEAALNDARLKNGACVRMLEAHATGTLVGDPIEIAAISQVYGRDRSEQSLSLGSVKGNIGHANTAAGAMSMGKALMCIYKDTLVKSGNFSSCSEPIHVEIKKSERLIEIQTATERFEMTPRMAGVSAIGIGGTCVHAILEEAPHDEMCENNSSHIDTQLRHYIPISAASPYSLKKYIQKLADYVDKNEDISLASLGYTLGLHRPQFNFRKCIFMAAADSASLKDQVLSSINAISHSIHNDVRRNTVALIFSGQGIELPARDYPIPVDIISALGFNPLQEYWDKNQKDPVMYQLSLFAVQVGIGKCIISLLCPDTKFIGLGHSLGEWVAAALAGLLSIEEAALCVKARAEILLSCAGHGSMICVCASLSETQIMLNKFQNIDLEVACINCDNRIILSGSSEDCEFFVKSSGLFCKRIDVNCAFHSKYVEQGLQELEDCFRRICVKPPNILPNWHVVSSHNAELITNSSCAPQHWVKQARERVEFVKAVSRVGELAGPEGVWFLSLGVTRSQCANPPKADMICCENSVDIKAHVMQMWELGISVNMKNIVGSAKRLLSLPSYVWDRENCWPESTSQRTSDETNNDCKVSGNFSANFKQNLYSESWFPVYSLPDVDMFCSKNILNIPHFNLGGSIEEMTRMGCLSSQYRQEVMNCCDDIKNFGRIVLSIHVTDYENNINENIPEAQCVLLSRFLFLIQAILKSSESLASLRFPLPHRRYSNLSGAIVLVIDERFPSFAASGAVLGAARCVANEHPELNLQIVRSRLKFDTDNYQCESYQRIGHLFCSASIPRGEYRFCSCDDVKVRIMQPLQEVSTRSQKNVGARIGRENGMYAVSGGLGGLGKLVANWLCSEKGAKMVYLLTRHSSTEVPDECLPFAEKVQVINADVTDFEALSRCVVDWNEISGVVHCAGCVFDYLVAKAPIEQQILEDEIFAKTLGLFNMMRLVKPDVDFICFSSASGCLGSLGQVTYSAANAAMDIMVDMERGISGRNSVCIQWGGWSKDIPSSMSDKYNVVPVGPFERFFSAATGIQMLDYIYETILGRKEVTTCLAMDVTNWESYISSTGVSDTLLGALSMKNCVASLGEYCLRLPFHEQAIWQAEWAWLVDHKVNGHAVFPATASLELLMRTRAGNSCLNEVMFKKVINGGDVIKVDELQITIEGDVCVSVASSAFDKELMRSLRPISAACIVTAATALTASGSHLSVVSSCDIYSKMKENDFDYGPSFSLLDYACVDVELGVAIGHVKKRLQHEQKSDLFPLTPELDACTHLCSALDSEASASFPVSLENFVIQNLDFDNIDSFSKLQTFYTKHSVTESDWVVICRRHCARIPNEFDIVCLRKCDSCIVTFERLSLHSQSSRSFEQGSSFSNCICVNAAVEKSSIYDVIDDYKDINVEERKSSFTNCRGFDGNEDFEVIIDADYKPTFRPFLLMRQPIPVDHIIVRTSTYALNFLDVLSASGMMPKEYFGGECVGIVEAVGANVTRLRAGDRVALLLLGEGMKSRLCVHVSLASPPLPPSISDEEAATIPVAYATAWLALEWMVQLRDDDTALVHSAAGGVGLACVSLLKSHSCRILGTCSPGKEHALEALGIQPSNIFPSRQPNSWVSGCLKATGGKPGVTLCIGSFVGSNLKHSLDLMAPLGRVVDFGKRNQMEQHSINMAPFLKGLSYTAAHLDELMTAYPEKTESLLNEIWSSLYKRVFPLPFKLFSVDDVQSGMKLLSSGNVVGKVVLRFPHAAEPTWEILNSPSWMVRLNGDAVSSEGQDILDCHVRKLGGGMYQDLYCERAVPTVFLQRGDNGCVPIPVSHCSSRNEKVVVISEEMWSNFTCYAEYCANICLYAVNHSQATVLLCALKTSLLKSTSLPQPWRKISRELQQPSSQDVNIDHELEWLLKVVAETTGRDEEEISVRTLHELGFDSLSCLQLSHKYQLQFRGKVGFQLPGDVIVNEIFDSIRKPATNCKEKVQYISQIHHKNLRSLPQAKSRKWLALHGFRLNDEIFRFQMENIINEVNELQQNGRKNQSFEKVVYLNAPLTATGPGENGLQDLYITIVETSKSDKLEISGAMSLYEWWGSGNEKDDYDTAWIGSHGLKESFEWLQKVVQRDQYEGVLGMSQGAGMAYLLMLTGVVPRGLLFSPVGPDNCVSFMRYILDSPTLGEIGDVNPLQVIWDPSDEPSNAFVKDIIEPGPLKFEQIHHDGGHIVPQDVSKGKFAKRRYIVDSIAKWLSNAM